MYKQSITYIFLIFLVFALWSCHNRNYTTTTIRYETAGCFGSEERVIKIDHYKDKAIATLNINGKKIKQATLTEGQIHALSMFPREIKEWADKQDPYSSTIDENISIKMGHISEVVHYSGHWDGFERLTAVLGLEN